MEHADIKNLVPRAEPPTIAQQLLMDAYARAMAAPEHEASAGTPAGTPDDRGHAGTVDPAVADSAYPSGHYAREVHMSDSAGVPTLAELSILRDFSLRSVWDNLKVSFRHVGYAGHSLWLATKFTYRLWRKQYK